MLTGEQRLTYEEIGRRLVGGLPECFVCPICGPFVRSDEDGCCSGCGHAVLIERSADWIEPPTERRTRTETPPADYGQAGKRG